MKVIVTGRNVFIAGSDGKGSYLVEIGTDLEFADEQSIPGWLTGKYRVADERTPPEPEQVAVTNPAKDAKPGKGE